MNSIKPKVGIMTWYTYRNYGSALQASALYHTVQRMGYRPSFINYLPKGDAATQPKLNLSKRASGKIKKLINPNYSSEALDELYERYLEERTSCTELCNSYPELHDLNKEYDAFICGSDQIWSPLCYDSKYFLDFVENPNKMIAYAPSIGSTKIDDPIIRERMARHISRFNFLTVREQLGADLIKSLTGQDAKVVLDPTLLMCASEWDAFAKTEETKKLNGHYILCYFLGNSEKYMEYVQLLSKKVSIPFYVVPVTVRQKKSGHCVPFEVGPSEFVSLIRNAAYVCTDSFHGMAFAINYNIPFSVFKRFKDSDPKNQNSRIFNLLKMLKLENRLTNYANQQSAQMELACDFTEANKCLREQREDSLACLKEALETAVCARATQNTVPFMVTDMCCGCGACATVCSKNAISIRKNDEGFEHFFVDTSKCVGCGMCRIVCPMTNVIAPHIKKSKALYAAKSCSAQVLKKSSSGGVGYQIASELLRKEYAICGCAYDILDNSAKHIWVMPGDQEKLSLLQGSKYIQSISSNALKQIAEIAEKRKIAFFGTPCQVAAVDNILTKKNMRQNALLIDLICHGVPSYHLWRKYLKDLEKKHGTGEHPSVLFRSKEREWRKLLIRVEGNNQVYKKEEQKDDFYAFFRRGLCYPESCSDCPYRERSAADLRIGDYWGDKFVHDKQGVSMVIANTDQGDALIHMLKAGDVCTVTPQDLLEYWLVQFPYNPQRPLIREQLIEELKDENTDLHTLRKKYCSYYDRVEKIKTVAYKVEKIVKRC